MDVQILAITIIILMIVIIIAIDQYNKAIINKAVLNAPIFLKDVVYWTAGEEKVLGYNQLIGYDKDNNPHHTIYIHPVTEICVVINHMKQKEISKDINCKEAYVNNEEYVFRFCNAVYNLMK